MIRNLNSLIKKIEKESQTLLETQSELKKELKIINAEIESYNKQLVELEHKEKDILKAAMSGEAANARKEKKEL